MTTKYQWLPSAKEKKLTINLAKVNQNIKPLMKDAIDILAIGKVFTNFFDKA